MFPSDQMNEREMIRQLTQRLTSTLQHEFSQFPRDISKRFPAIALASAVENPYLPFEILQDMVKVTVWIFTIDTMIDEKLLPEKELRERLASYEDIVRGKSEAVDRKDPYGTVLLDIVKRLQSSPLYPNLKALWEEVYTKMIQGMLFEASHGTEDVSLTEYLEQGQYSVGLPMYVVSSWILQSENILLKHLQDLVRMMRLSGICIRLANDLRTYEKERCEKNLNAVFLKEKEWISRGKQSDVARQLSLEEITQLMNSYMNHFLSMKDTSVPLNESLIRITRFSVGFYSKYDFHTVTAPKIDQELRTL
jgi:hypothetical protein